MDLHGFNPSTGDIEDLPIPAPPRLQQTQSSRSSREVVFNSSSRSSTNRPRSLWDRIYGVWDSFDDIILEIGNFFAGLTENIVEWASGSIFILEWIGFAIFVISIWVNEGFVWALVAGLIGGGIFYYISFLVAIVIAWILFFVVAILRFIFYRAWSFVLVLALVGGVIAYEAVGIQKFRHLVEEAHSSPHSTTPYYCTASSVLNVREAPDRNARVIGTLSHGEQVDVYDFTSSGFARINFHGREAYVSEKYISSRK